MKAGNMMKIFNKLEEWLAGSLFMLMFAILIVQIFSRQILGSPLTWSEELARLIFVYVGMLGVSLGIRNRQHIYIDFLYDKFPPKMKKNCINFFTNSNFRMLTFLSIFWL